MLEVAYVPITYHNSVNFLINTLTCLPITQRLAKNWYPIHNLFIQIVVGLDVSILIIQIAKTAKSHNEISATVTARYGPYSHYLKRVQVLNFLSIKVNMQVISCSSMANNHQVPIEMPLDKR